MQLGLQYNIEATPYLPPFDEGMLRESLEFTSLWESDYPAEKYRTENKNPYSNGSIV
jgi:hypothetical protein